jgi:hypothetical protein
MSSYLCISRKRLGFFSFLVLVMLAFSIYGDIVAREKLVRLEGLQFYREGMGNVVPAPHSIGFNVYFDSIYHFADSDVIEIAVFNSTIWSPSDAERCGWYAICEDGSLFRIAMEVQSEFHNAVVFNFSVPSTDVILPANIVTFKGEVLFPISDIWPAGAQLGIDVIYKKTYLGVYTHSMTLYTNRSLAK